MGVLGITSEDALAAMAEKRRKEDELIKNREHNNYMRMWRMERDNLLAKGIIARKDEKARLKRVKDLRVKFAGRQAQIANTCTHA